MPGNTSAASSDANPRPRRRAPWPPSWPEHAMAPFAVVRLNPPGFVHAGIFAEVSETIHHGLRALGHDCALVENTVLPDRVNVIFSGHLLCYFGDFALPPRTVLFNLEPLRKEILQLAPGYDALLRHPGVGAIWEYDARNLPALRALGAPQSTVVPIGYAAEMSRIPAAPEQDIDVLFYGVQTPRRLAMQQILLARGLNAQFQFGIYGAERDALIARAKVVLNLSQFETDGIFDTVRLSYLLANRKCIVAESGIDTAQEAAFGRAVAFAPYDEVADECAYFCAMPAERERQAAAGLEFFKNRPQSEYLRQPVARLMQQFNL